MSNYSFTVQTDCMQRGEEPKGLPSNKKSVGVGVTSLLCRFLDDSEPDYYHGLGRDIDFKIRTLFLANDTEAKLKTYEIPHETLRFKNRPTPNQVTADIVVIAFDLTNQASLDWAVKRFKDYKANTPDKTIVLAGTKNDLTTQHEISKKTLDELNKELGVTIQLTSAKTSQGVDELFEYAAKERIATVEIKKQAITTAKNTQIKQWKDTPKYKNEVEYFESIWNREPHLTDKSKVLALLNDYTKGNSFIGRFFAGHLDRNHVPEVNAIHVLSNKKTVEKILEELNDLSLKNETGTLATIIDFIETKLNKPSSKNNTTHTTTHPFTR